MSARYKVRGFSCQHSFCRSRLRAPCGIPGGARPCCEFAQLGHRLRMFLRGVHLLAEEGSDGRRGRDGLVDYGLLLLAWTQILPWPPHGGRCTCTASRDCPSSSAVVPGPVKGVFVEDTEVWVRMAFAKSYYTFFTVNAR